MTFKIFEFVNYKIVVSQEVTLFIILITLLCSPTEMNNIRNDPIGGAVGTCLMFWVKTGLNWS